ncbi:MAG: hypothetical protein Q8Q47_08620 [Ignavibacteriaceae bacterium]|nr:hypothetical protein [Ignavibacteriaceae bacterium]
MENMSLRMDLKILFRQFFSNVRQGTLRLKVFFN